MDMSLTTLILLQLSVSLLILVSLQWFFAWSHKKKDEACVKDLIERIQQRKQERSAFLDAYLQTNLNWQEDRQNTVDLLLKAERTFLKELVASYLARDPQLVANWDARLYELLEQYQFLSPTHNEIEPSYIDEPVSASSGEAEQLKKDKKRLTRELHQSLRVLNELFIEHSAMFGDMNKPERDLSVQEIQDALASMGHGSKPRTSEHESILSALSAPSVADDWQSTDPFSGYDESGDVIAEDRSSMAPLKSVSADFEMNLAEDAADEPPESEDDRLAREWEQQLAGADEAEPDLNLAESDVERQARERWQQHQESGATANAGLNLDETEDERLAREWEQQLTAGAEPVLDVAESEDDRLAREWEQQLGGGAEPALDVTESEDDRLAREWEQQLSGGAEPVLDVAESEDDRLAREWEQQLGGGVEPALDVTESEDERLAREWEQQLGGGAEPALDVTESEDERLAREWEQQLSGGAEPVLDVAESEDERLAREWERQLSPLAEEDGLFSEDQLSSLLAELDEPATVPSASTKK